VFLRDIVCLRNICINTLHKGESDDGDGDDDDDNDDDYKFCGTESAAKKLK
jgi:hypothetical protein